MENSTHRQLKDKSDLVDQNILRFQITMQNTFAVTKFHFIKKLKPENKNKCQAGTSLNLFYNENNYIFS